MLQDVDPEKEGKPVPKDRPAPVLLAVGANLDSSVGPAQATIAASLQDLTKFGVRVQAVSRYFVTPAFPPGSGPDYVNAAILCHSDLSPPEILAVLHRIEDKYGRKRENRWGARSLDLDLLAVADQVLPERATYEHWRLLGLDEQKAIAPSHLILPHPRLQDRAFVLVPLMDVAPNWVHPVLGQTTAQMLAALPATDQDEIAVM